MKSIIEIFFVRLSDDNDIIKIQSLSLGKKRAVICSFINLFNCPDSKYHHIICEKIN